MALYTQERAIKEYYETIKDQHPDLNFEQVSEICKAPFIFFKKCIQSGELPRIYVKYFGKFMVFKRKLLFQKKLDGLQMERGRIDPDRYENNMKFYQQYLKDLNNDYQASSEIDTDGESDV